jgi:hypothetical protein
MSKANPKVPIAVQEQSKPAAGGAAAVEWSVGALCTAKYAADGKFYPAQVVEVTPKGIKVSFTEYQNEFQVCQAKDLKAFVVKTGPAQAAVAPKAAAAPVKAAPLSPKQDALPKSGHPSIDFMCTELPAGATASLLRIYFSIFGEVSGLDFDSEKCIATVSFSSARYPQGILTAKHRFMGRPICVMRVMPKVSEIEEGLNCLSRRHPRTIPSPQFCSAVLGRMSAASLRLPYHRAYSYLSNMARKDQLRALCGVVPGMLVVRLSMSGGASDKTVQRMIACIVQRVAAVRAAATLEGALLAEWLIWDGPMRSRSLEKSIKKVI